MYLCLICDKNIVDASAKSKGQDSVFCEGLCQGWLHRTFANLTSFPLKSSVVELRFEM